MPVNTVLAIVSPEWTRDDTMIYGFFFKFFDFSVISNTNYIDMFLKHLNLILLINLAK